jgi:hypothetical protein
MIIILIILTFGSVFLHFRLTNQINSFFPVFLSIANIIIGLILILHLLAPCPVPSFISLLVGLIVVQAIYFGIGAFSTYKHWKSLLTKRIIEIDDYIQSLRKQGYRSDYIEKALGDRYVKNNYGNKYEYSKLLPEISDYSWELTEHFYLWLPKLVGDKIDKIIKKIENKGSANFLAEIEDKIKNIKNDNNG